MTDITIVEQMLLDTLKADETLSNIRFERAWEDRKGRMEQGVTAYLKIAPISFVPASLDHSIRRAELMIHIWISAEKELGSTACVDAFSRISDALLFGENGLCLQTISCGKVEYSNMAEAFQMESQIGMTGYCQEDGV